MCYNRHRFCCFLGERNERKILWIIEYGSCGYQFYKELWLFKVSCDGGNFCLTDIYSFFFYRRWDTWCEYDYPLHHYLSYIGFVVHVSAISKLLQLIPASSILISHVEFLFWSSLFLGDDYWSVFMVLIVLSIMFQLLTFVYQLLIVPKAKKLPHGEYRKNLLFLPSVVYLLISVIVIVIVRLFTLPAVYVVPSLVVASIVCLPFYWLEYARVFTGWKK